MNQLYNIQHKFWDNLRSHEADPASTQLFSPGGKLTQIERLEIYRNTMRTAHTNALAQTYRCCEMILGKRYFEQIAKDYYYEYPATDQNLNLYGQSFPMFLHHWTHNHRELLEYQYLFDLARLELAYDIAYYAKQDPCFDFNLLATLDEDSHQRICFTLSSSLTVLKSNYPIYEIRLANLEQEYPQEISEIDELQYLCIVREDLKPTIHKIDYNYWWIIDSIQNKSTLSELEVLATKKEMKTTLQTIIPELLQNKWICGYHLKDD